MKFKIKLDYFKKIKSIGTFISSSSGLKIHSENILLVCKDYNLTVYATDGITNIKLELPESENLRIIKEGRVFIDSKTLISLIDYLKNDEVEIFKTENNVLKLICGLFVCDLKITDEKNFIFDNFDTTKYEKITVNINLLKLIVKRFKEFCQLPSDTSQSSISTLTSINIKKNDVENKIDVCSTDAYRMVYGQFEYAGPKFNINILPNTLNNIVNLFKNENEFLDLYISDKNIIVNGNNNHIKSRLISGIYPDVLLWFNSSCEVKIIIDKQKLLDSIEKGLLLSSQSLKNILLTIKDQELIIEYKDGDKGSSQEIIPIENILKTNIEISVNSQYLKSLIRNIDDKKIVFDLISPLKPVIIKGYEADQNFKQLILPTRSY